MKELNWKHNKWQCPCSVCSLKQESNDMEILTPYPKKRNKVELFLNRYNHIMEFVRTFIQLLVLALQLIILYRLTD